MDTMVLLVRNGEIGMVGIIKVGDLSGGCKTVVKGSGGGGFINSTSIVNTKVSVGGVTGNEITLKELITNWLSTPTWEIKSIGGGGGGGGSSKYNWNQLYGKMTTK
jgi:hypothetical protein